MILPGFLWFSARSERYGADRQTAKYRSERALNHKKTTESQNPVLPGFCLDFARILLKIRPDSAQIFTKMSPVEELVRLLSSQGSLFGDLFSEYLPLRWSGKINAQNVYKISLWDLKGPKFQTQFPELVWNEENTIIDWINQDCTDTVFLILHPGSFL